MKLFALLISLLTFQLLPSVARATFDLGLEGNFFNSAHTLSNEKDTQIIYGDAYLTLPFEDKSKTSFLFNFTFLDEGYKSTDTTNVSIMHFGAMAGIQQAIGSVLHFSVMGTPYIQSNYQLSGNPKEQWSGWAYQARLSIEGKISFSTTLVASINYFSATYTQKSANATSTQSSFSRQAIIPAAGFRFEF